MGYFYLRQKGYGHFRAANMGVRYHYLGFFCEIG